jgi:hypothetical protein
MSALPRLIWLIIQKPNRWLFHSALLALCLGRSEVFGWFLMLQGKKIKLLRGE